jgi:hypothetical protein
VATVRLREAALEAAAGAECVLWVCPAGRIIFLATAPKRKHAAVKASPDYLEAKLKYESKNINHRLYEFIIDSFGSCHSRLFTCAVF